MLDGLSRDGALRSQLGEGPIANRLAPVGQEPANWDSVTVREIQGRPPLGSVGNRGVKIVRLMGLRHLNLKRLSSNTLGYLSRCSPAALNSLPSVQTGWALASATASAVRSITFICWTAPSMVNHGSSWSWGW